MDTNWMKKRMLWENRKLIQMLFREKVILEKYNNKNILDNYQTNMIIRDMFQSKQPFMIGRLGYIELHTMVAFEENNKFHNRKKEFKNKICSNAGFFTSNDSDYERYVELMRNSCQYVDLLGVWSNYMEDYITDKYCSDSIIYAKLSGLEPWYAETQPWSELLEHKKVLFIHPFEETILSQSKHRKDIYPNKNVLPEFELKTLKAVQTLADNEDSRFKSWFDALEFMYQEASKQTFDIAIIGCGAYGFPLAAMLKKSGKTAIHLGGAVQLFWGIKGKRWDNHPYISRLYNDYWTTPLEENKPKNYKLIENGCYW